MISGRGEIDQFQFTANAGEKLQIAMAGELPVSGRNAFNVRMEVLDPSGRPVLARSSRHAVVQPLDVRASGVYTVRIHAAIRQEIGAYRVGLESISSPSPDSRLLRPGNIRAGSIATDIEQDQYHFNARTGDKLVIRSSSADGSNGGLDRLLQIFGPNGRRIYGVGTASPTLREFTIPATGQYVIQISSTNGRGTGGYRVGLESISPPSFNATSLPRGQSATARIAGPLQTYQYKIDATGSNKLTFKVDTLAGMETFRPQLTLYTSDGRRITNRVLGKNGEFIYSITPNHGTQLLLLVNDTSSVATGRFKLAFS